MPYPSTTRRVAQEFTPVNASRVRHDVTGGGPGAQAQLHRGKYSFACSGSALESGAAEPPIFADRSTRHCPGRRISFSTAPALQAPVVLERRCVPCLRSRRSETAGSVVNLLWDSGLDCTAGPNFCVAHESTITRAPVLHLIHPHPMTGKIRLAAALRLEVRCFPGRTGVARSRAVDGAETKRAAMRRPKLWCEALVPWRTSYSGQDRTTVTHRWTLPP
jgi:hypothetical protein